MHGGERGRCRTARRCRTSRHHDTTLLPRPSRSGDHLEDLHRAATELIGSLEASAPVALRGGEGNQVPSSLNLLATSSVIASIASSASGPLAETTIEVPGAAESIINPMIEVPPTVSPPRVTQTSASKRSTI